MAPKNDEQPTKKGEGNAEPEWARGLRELYDGVVDEPLPPSFDDLLAKLDKPKK